MKLKGFCTTKEIVSKLKRLPTERKKIFASYTSDKEQITRIYRVLKNPHSQNINDPMKKWAKELNRAFSKEEVQMSKRHRRKCSTYLAIKEMQIKTMLKIPTHCCLNSYHQEPKQQQMLASMQGEKEPSCTADEE
jgi:hypothetical protein